MFSKQAFLVFFVAAASTASCLAADLVDGNNSKSSTSSASRSAPLVEISDSDLETLREGARKMLVKGQTTKKKSDTNLRSRRALKGSKGKDLDKVLIKSMNCAGCLEVPGRFDPLTITPGNCDVNDDKQIWDLKSLEATGTWFQFESEEFKDECMTLISDCGAGFDFEIKLERCDDKNPKAAWGVVGGMIYNFDCFINENDRFTPDVLLQGACFDGNADQVNMESLSSDDADTQWVIFPSDIEFFSNNGIDNILNGAA